MKHLYRNEYGAGEIVAADTLDDAARYHDCTLAGQDEPGDDWVEVPDDESLTLHHDDVGDVTRLARDWAADFDKVTIAGTMYA